MYVRVCDAARLRLTLHVWDAARVRVCADEYYRSVTLYVYVYMYDAELSMHTSVCDV